MNLTHFKLTCNIKLLNRYSPMHSSIVLLLKHLILNSHAIHQIFFFAMRSTLIEFLRGFLSIKFYFSWCIAILNFFCKINPIDKISEYSKTLFFFQAEASLSQMLTISKKVHQFLKRMYCILRSNGVYIVLKNMSKKGPF